MKNNPKRSIKIVTLSTVLAAIPLGLLDTEPAAASVSVTFCFRYPNGAVPPARVPNSVTLYYWKGSWVPNRYGWTDENGCGRWDNTEADYWGASGTKYSYNCWEGWVQGNRGYNHGNGTLYRVC